MPFCFENQYGFQMTYKLVISKASPPTTKEELENVPEDSYTITKKDNKMVLDLEKSLRSSVGASQYYILIQ